MSSPCRASVALALLTLLLAGPAAARDLRVCTEPNNLPFSDRAGAGFENRIAGVLAEALGGHLVPVLIAQHGPGFLRATIGAGRCDAIMGMPLGSHGVALTRPYYRTGWVFVTRGGDALRPASFDDPGLRGRSIGVPVVGEGADTAPLIALGRRGLVDRLQRYAIGGDLADGDDAPEQMVADVARGRTDVALLWGPSAGYFAAAQPVPLTLTPTPRDDGPNVPFALDIAVATKPGNPLRDALDAALAREMPRVRAVLAAFHVPVLE